MRKLLLMLAAILGLALVPAGAAQAHSNVPPTPYHHYHKVRTIATMDVDKDYQMRTTSVTARLYLYHRTTPHTAAPDTYYQLFRDGRLVTSGVTSRGWITPAVFRGVRYPHTYTVIFFADRTTRHDTQISMTR